MVDLSAKHHPLRLCSILWGLALLLCSTTAVAQVTQLGGVVIDARTEERIAGASIELLEMGLIKSTSEKGTFLFRLEKEVPGVQVVISAVGYVTDTVLVATSSTQQRFYLNATAQAMNEVVVSGTMRQVLRSVSPIPVEVYTPQFFKKNPAPSIFESLQNVNGVRPQINCSVCNTGDIHINGLEGPYTMVTIDGMPIVSSLSTVYGLFGIPSQLMERVEIVKGPASGLYGSEAIGGLINIITKTPQKAPLFSANLMTTSWLEHSVDLGLRLGGKKVASLLGMNYFNYQKPFDKNGDNFTDLTLQHRVSVFNKWSFERPLNRKASLAARYFYEDRWGGEMQWNKRFRGGDQVYGESIYTKRWEVIGAYQLPVPERLVLSFSTTSHDQDSYYGTTPYMAQQKIAFGQLVWDKDLSAKQNLLVGFAGRYNHYDDNSTATIDTLTKQNRPDQYFLPGVFVQNEWNFGSKILLIGMRYDHHSVHKAILTPRLAFKWTLDEKQEMRLNTGTGFRVVNLFTEEHAALTGARAVEIKEELKPEKSYNVNLHYLRRMGRGSHLYNLNVSAWYSYFKNRIIADYDVDPNKIVYANLQGHALSRGVSVNIDMNLQQRLKGDIGFTLQDVVKVEPDMSGRKTREQQILTERWSGTWTLTYTLPVQGINIDYTGNVYGPMRLPLLSDTDPRRSHSPVWSIQNIQLTKWLPHGVEIFGGVKNLLNWTPTRNNPFLIARAHDPFDKNVSYDNSGNVVATPENPYALTFDPSYIYAPNQGIRAFAGIRWVVK